MHSRSFLHRLSDTPRASAAEVEPVEHHPLGFADVRSSEQAAAGPRRPLGFVVEPEPTFVTEMSFRRTPTATRGADVMPPARGVTPVTTEEAPSVGQATGVPAYVEPVSMADGDRVPFYKREITLRRRKPEDAGEIVETDAVELAEAKPIGFAWEGENDKQADEAPAVEETPAVEVAPVVELPVADTSSDEAEVIETPSPVEVVAEAEGDDAQVEVQATPPVVDPVVAASDDFEIDGLEDALAEVYAETEPESAAPVAEVELEDEPVAEVELEDEPVAEIELEDEPVAEVEVVADPVAEAELEDEPLAEVEDELEGVPAPLPIIPLPVADEPAAETEEPVEGKKKRGSIRSGRSPKPAAKKSGPKGPRSGRKVVGLKIGASQLAAAVVSRVDGQNQLVDIARTPLEPGIVVDGEVRDADSLRDALKSFFAEHKLPKRDVRIGVASNRIGVRTFDIAGIDDQERFDNAVRFKAHEVLPVSVHESVLDYRVVDERVVDGGEVVRRVLLVVAPRDQVEPFAAACSSAGVRLGGIDLESLALLRAFVEPQPFSLRTATDTATVVVAIGHESTSLLVSGGGTCEFTRVFDWGGSTLQHAIAQELDISEPEAGALLQSLSLSGTSSLPQEQASRALDAVRARLTPFARELVSSLQFYQSQPDSLGIGEIVITGGTSHLEGLGDALHQMIGVSVRVGNPLQRVAYAGQLDPALAATIGSLAIPIGLAIEDDALRSVNLLPAELRATGRQKPKLINVALPIAAVVPFAAMGMMFMNASADVTDRQGQLDTVQAEISALPEPTRPVIDPTLELAQQQRASALATVLGSRIAWDGVLTDLSRALPANVWLKHFTAKAPEISPYAPAPAALPASPGSPVANAAPTGVVIEGYTYSLTDVARLLAHLNTLPSLRNVVLGTSTKTMIGKREAVSFTINADIASAGGAQ